MEETKIYTVTPIYWTAEYNDEIAEAYRLLKDQERKIFDLAWHEDNPEGVMRYIEDQVRNNMVFIVKSEDKVAGVFMLENFRTYKNTILACDIHCAISKKFWGEKARNVCKAFAEFLKQEYNINRVIANVPQCGYGVIKLLKSVGFKHEGTVKKVLVFKDKDGNDKLYDGLIYGLDLEE